MFKNVYRNGFKVCNDDLYFLPLGRKWDFTTPKILFYEIKRRGIYTDSIIEQMVLMRLKKAICLNDPKKNINPHHLKEKAIAYLTGSDTGNNFFDHITWKRCLEAALNQMKYKINPQSLLKRWERVNHAE